MSNVPNNIPEQPGIPEKPERPFKTGVYESGMQMQRSIDAVTDAWRGGEEKGVLSADQVTAADVERFLDVLQRVSPLKDWNLQRYQHSVDTAAIAARIAAALRAAGHDCPPPAAFALMGLLRNSASILQEDEVEYMRKNRVSQVLAKHIVSPELSASFLTPQQQVGLRKHQLKELEQERAGVDGKQAHGEKIYDSYTLQQKILEYAGLRAKRGQGNIPFTFEEIMTKLHPTRDTKVAYEKSIRKPLQWMSSNRAMERVQESTLSKVYSDVIYPTLEKELKDKGVALDNLYHDIIIAEQHSNPGEPQQNAAIGQLQLSRNALSEYLRSHAS